VAKKTAKNATPKTSQADAKRERVSAEALPRRSLEQAVEVAKTMRAVYAAKSVSIDELAKAMKTTRNVADFKYCLWAAVAYGIVNAEGPKMHRTYSLAETGRKIVAENIPGEANEAKVKALLTPTVLSKFFTDYNGHPIPPSTNLANVLEDQFGVPRDRTTEAIEIIMANGKYAGILEDQGEEQAPIVKLTGVPTGEQPIQPPSPGAPKAEATLPATGWDKTCFYITPIDKDGSEQRKHADMMLKHVVRPAFEEQGFTVVRADEIAKSGIITKQVFEYLANAKVCVADLSFHNPNAFYELGVRHAFLLPTIQLIHKEKSIPFDVSQGRTITVDTSDNYMVTDHLESARKTLVEFVKNLLTDKSGSEDNPVAAYLPTLKVSFK
jgi:hypothetical protein